ncbi:MFS transporter [Leucobacter sp. UT-8R-CII-1-4]|uniref:MFS transporter n=1 Tax=Leucobacter sp. UT-8R-CII-1-4 TaxID=3040075 RepID=UPI0024A83976|nr:MFS transporter [Leucobacter sp. UT-8R-CII-1-4]MDI6024576.1 MFS transporter [Leucobacter sp. UT-8R-CII-1-4]
MILMQEEMNANTVGRAPQLSKARRWAALAVLTASLLVITMDMTILNIALPDLAAELHPTAEQQLWIIDIYSLVLAGLLVSWAAIADRWGRKRMLMLGYAIFSVASLLVLFATTAESVIAIRAFLGVGGAMIMPTTLSLIRIIFTDAKERATALGIWAAVSGLGAAVGPLVGGFLLEHFSWHAAFLVNVPLMAAAMLAGFFFLPESRVSNPGRWDALAALLSFGGMILLVWAIKQFGKQASFAVPEAWAATVGAAILLTWFVRRCLRSESPLLDLTLFKSRPFSAGIVAALGTTFSMVAALLLIAQWLQLIDGASPIEAGVRLMPVAVAGAIASMAAPALARAIGARAVLAGGLGLAGFGMLYIGLLGDNLDLIGVEIAMTLVGAGTGSLAIGSAMIMMGSPVEKAGNAGALEETSYELGATIGVAILGSISALIYRFQLSVDPAMQGIEQGLLGDAKESLGAAMAISNEAGLPQLAESAAEAFNRSLQVVGYAGGFMMLAVAAFVFFLTPKGTDVTEAEH